METYDKNIDDSVLISSERILTRLLEQVWTILLVVLNLIGLAAILRTYMAGWQTYFSLPIALAIFFSGSFLLRRKLSFDVRIGIVMIIFYVAGISALFFVGLVAAGVWWLVLCALLGTVFYPRHIALLHAAASLVLICGAAYAFLGGLLTLPFDADSYVRNPFTWIGLIIACVLLSIFLFAAVAAYQRASLGLLREMAENKRQLEESMREIRTLRSFIPICAQCKQVRDDKGYWASVEEYLAQHTEISFSHCMCPDCGRKLYGDEWGRAMQKRDGELPL